MPEWEQSWYYWLHRHCCRVPSQLIASWSEAARGPEIGSSQCNTLHCRSRIASKMHSLQQPFHFSPSGLIWRPWPLKANGKSSISSGFRSGFMLLQGQLLERAKFFTVRERVILDLLHLYVKKKKSEARWALQDVAWPSWGMGTSQKNKKCNFWHRWWYRKDQEDVLTSSSYPAFLLPRKTLGSLLLCTNNKRTGTFVSLK